MANDYAGKALGLFALAAIATLGVWKLVELRANGPHQFWITLTYCLVGLSAITGGSAALLARNSHAGAVSFWGFVVQAIAAIVVVAVLSGGGFSGWTAGFWIVSAVGWISGYIWFLAFFAIVFSLLPKRREKVDAVAQARREHDTYLQNLDDRLR